MSLKQIKTRENIDKPKIEVEKIADANTVIGKSIITVSGAEVIPLSQVTIVNMNGGGEYGDIKTLREIDGFKFAGGNGTVITVKPKGFLVDEGKGCRLLRMEEGAIDTLIDKTGEIVHKFSKDA